MVNKQTSSYFFFLQNIHQRLQLYDGLYKKVQISIRDLVPRINKWILLIAPLHPIKPLHLICQNLIFEPIILYWVQKHNNFHLESFAKKVKSKLVKFCRSIKKFYNILIVFRYIFQNWSKNVTYPFSNNKILHLLDSFVRNARNEVTIALNLIKL